MGCATRDTVVREVLGEVYQGKELDLAVAEYNRENPMVGDTIDVVGYPGAKVVEVGDALVITNARGKKIKISKSEVVGSKEMILTSEKFTTELPEVGRLVGVVDGIAPVDSNYQVVEAINNRWWYTDGKVVGTAEVVHEPTSKFRVEVKNPLIIVDGSLDGKMKHDVVIKPGGFSNTLNTLEMVGKKIDEVEVTSSKLMVGDPIRSGSYLEIGDGEKIVYDGRSDSNTHRVDTPFGLGKGEKVEVQIVGSRAVLTKDGKKEVVELGRDRGKRKMTATVRYNTIKKYAPKNEC